VRLQPTSGTRRGVDVTLSATRSSR
jgi:hypothetical protein